ncbi:MAG: DUF4157 domain-containing protein [Myxococcota bacterium]
MTSRYAVRDRQPVQREAGAPRPQGELQAAAEAGTAGPGAALPHAERIQGAFGHHDLGAVQAYTGAAATQASEAMGANAFATGSKVAFRGAPSLHTAAHEAAHVIQQRGGVSLSGGVGRAGDRYEREADQVADAVVAGHSAEPILDRSAGGSGGGSDAVQLDTGSPTPAAPRAPTPAARPRPEGAASGAAGGTAHDDGAAPDPSRAVVAQLNDPAIWEVPPDDPTASANLQSMLSLAVAQGQAGAAYSIALRLHKAESHRAVLVRAGVVDEQGHVTPSTPPQRDRASLGQAVVGGADAVGTALDLVRRAEQSPEHFSRSGIRLDTLADVADYAAATPQPGIETRSDAQREAAERRSTLPVHFAHLSREQEQAQVNTLGIEAENGDHGGRLNLIIPGLALEALDTQVAGGSLSAMTIATGVVRVVATWPTPRCADAPTTFTVNIQSLALRRVAYLAGGSTFAMRELGAGSIVVHARSVPESVRRVRGPGEAPGAVREVLVEGSVAQAIVGFLVPHLSAFAGDALGAFHAAGRQGEQLPGGLTLDVHGLYVDGLTTPGGMHAARIDVGQAHVETERLRAPVTRMRMRQLEDRLREAQVRQAELQRQGGTDPVDAHERTRLDAERTQMQAQLEQLRAQIPQLEAEDNEYLGLLGRQQGGQSPLNDAERARLQALQATRTARMAIDVDRVAVTGFGMHAGEDRGSVAITGVHAETDTSGAMVNPFPSGRSAAEPRGTTTSGGPADNQLHIGRIRATDIHLGLPNYRQQHDHKAELDAIADADLSDAQRTERDGLRALWVRRVPNDTAFGTYGDIVDRLLAIEGRGDVALARDWAAQTERDRLQHALGRYQTTIGSIDVRGVSLGTQGTQSSVDAGAISGRAFAGDAQAAVGELDVHSVRSGDGDGADRAFATGVRGDASLLVSRMTQTDLHGRTQSDSHAAVREAHVAADTIRVEGAQVGATRVRAAQIDGARIDASSTRDGGTVGLHVDRMQVFDVQVPARLERLRAELAELNSGARTPARIGGARRSRARSTSSRRCPASPRRPSRASISSPPSSVARATRRAAPWCSTSSPTPRPRSIGCRRAPATRAACAPPARLRSSTCSRRTCASRGSGRRSAPT